MVTRKSETFEPVTMGHIRAHGCLVPYSITSSARTSTAMAHQGRSPWQS
jgi:hypothetical protein